MWDIRGVCFKLVTLHAVVCGASAPSPFRLHTPNTSAGRSPATPLVVPLPVDLFPRIAINGLNPPCQQWHTGDTRSVAFKVEWLCLVNQVVAVTAGESLSVIRSGCMSLDRIKIKAWRKCSCVLARDSSFLLSWSGNPQRRF